jgi:hypothetical protein
MTMYHREGEQEDFLVLDGECGAGRRGSGRGKARRLVRIAYEGIESRDRHGKEGWPPD